MVVRLAVDTTGFIDLANSDSLSTRANQRLLIGQLVQHAVLVRASEFDVARLPQTVRLLPQELRKLWTTFLTEVVTVHPTPAISPVLEEVSTPDELLEWADHISVALASDSAAECLGLNGEQARLIDAPSGIEITRLQAVDSERLRDAIDIQQRDVQAMESRDTTWTERFQAAASTEAPVTVLDRYAVTSLAKFLSTDSPCGLSWFLGKLATEANHSVHLIARANTASDAGRLVADLRRLGTRLPGTGVTSLSVTLAEDRHFREHSHPRHIRFGTITIGLDKGLTMFDTPLCPHSMPCSRISRDTARAREEQIEHLALTGFRRRIVW